MFDSLPASSQLKQLLLGVVPDVTWQLNRTDRLVQSWEQAKEQWTFLSSFFALAKANRVRLPMIPIMSFIALVGGQVPSLTLTTDLIMSSPLMHAGMEPRVYQYYTGFLREMHVGLYLSQYGPVYKRPIDDMSKGVDWYFGEKKIQIISSSNYWAKKSQKVSADTVVLTAVPSDGLSLVAIDAMAAIVASSSVD